MYYKNAFYNFLKIFVVLVATLVSVIYVSDPYRLFHDKFWNKNKNYADLRVQAYGLIKYNDFDNVIMGSSMLENTSANEATDKLGDGTWVNLSWSGQRIYERFKTLNYISRTHNLNNVIISVDDYSFEPHYVEENFEEKLYDDDIFTKWKIYLKSNAMFCMFLGHKCNMREIDLDRPNMWANDMVYARRFGGFDNWIKVAHEDIQISEAFKMLQSNASVCVKQDNYRHTIDTEIVPLFENKNTIFHLIIPPYSALYWAHVLHLNDFDCKMAPYKYLIDQAQNYPNVKIYWLYDEKFVFDIAVYKDLTHYTPDINSFQLDVIKRQSHLINAQNYNKKIQQFRHKLQSFDLKYYTDQVDKFYDASKLTKL